MLRRMGCVFASILLLLVHSCRAEASKEELEVIFFDCGKADCIFLKLGEHTALIDTGTDKAGKQVRKKLEAMGVESIDTLFITHPHKDHIGGADHLLQAFEVGEVLLGPLLLETKQTEEFVDEMKAQGKQARIVKPLESISLGEAVFTCLGPLRTVAEQENDLSLILRLDYGETSFLFTGDAERDALDDLMSASQITPLLRANVLKVPHHGRKERNTADFVALVMPQIAVIPCEPKTSDRLPDPEVLQALSDADATSYITGEGDITVRSDGKTLSATQGKR